MNSTMNRHAWVTAALCGAVLAGCDSIKDVREEPFTELPPASVVLQGEIAGLGSARSLVLMNNGNATGARSFLAPVPTVPNAGVTLTPFSFGSLPAGSSYNIEVRQQPTGKFCTPVNGSGILDASAPPFIRINCEDTATRYNLTVAVDPAFVAAQGARVTLTTEEAIYEIDPAPGATSVTFNNALFNPDNAQEPTFTWTVTASTTVGDTLNKCPVTGPTNSPATQNPTGHINPAGTGNPRVGACSFTISGSVTYSLPVGQATAPSMPPEGVTLQLRDMKQEVVATQTVTTYSTNRSTSNFTFMDGAIARQFQSNTGGVYEVIVSSHPPGQFCIVGDGGTANLYVTGLTNPVNVTAAGTTLPPATTPTLGTRLNVFCREVPAPGAALNGTYRLMSQTFKADADTDPGITISWTLDPNEHNRASSNMLTLFSGGTFLYGTHANATHVEHGFYQYDPVARTLRFTMHADTNTSAVFPSGFADTPTNAAPTTTSTPGLSATPGTVATGTGANAVRHSGVLSDVTLAAASATTPATMTGRFAGAVVVAATATAATPVRPNASLDWVLTEPPSVAGQMTGTWVTEDSRRSWIYDANTYYGFHMGVNGVTNLQDACFTMDDVSASTSYYTRRGTNTSCWPFSRPANSQRTSYAVGFSEAINFQMPADAAVPGFVGRLPGSATVTDGRPTSPMHFHIAPAATFFSTAFAGHFPATGASTAWCNGELLGIRATLNGVVIDQPVYFCRTRVN